MPPPNRITGLTERGQALANTMATALAQTPGLARSEITRLPGRRSRR